MSPEPGFESLTELVRIANTSREEERWRGEGSWGTKLRITLIS